MVISLLSLNFILPLKPFLVFLESFWNSSFVMRSLGSAVLPRTLPNALSVVEVVITTKAPRMAPLSAHVPHCVRESSNSSIDFTIPNTLPVPFAVAILLSILLGF